LNYLTTFRYPQLLKCDRCYVIGICKYPAMNQIELHQESEVGIDAENLEPLTPNEMRVHQILNSDPRPEHFAEMINIDPAKLRKKSRFEHLDGMNKLLNYFNYFRTISVATAVGHGEEGPVDIFDGAPQAEREDVSSTLNLSPMSAHRLIEDAKTITTHLPETLEALKYGEISQAHASIIAQQLAPLIEKGADPIILAELESKAVTFAESHTPAEAKRQLINRVAALDERGFEDRVEDAKKQRYVRLKPEENGMASIYALLPAEDAKLVMEVINDCAKTAQDRHLENLRATTNNSEEDFQLLKKLDETSIDTFRADALSEIATKYLTNNVNPNLKDRKPVLLQLTMDMATLIGLDEKPAQLVGYGPLPASLARILAADAKWQKFIVDPLTGNLINYGRKVYEPPQALKDFIIARDQTCRFIGCAQPARRCDLDHAVPWEEGGETSPENMGALCRRHHQLKTHGGWKLTSHPDGSCTWVSPRGKEFFVPVKPMNPAA